MSNKKGMKDDIIGLETKFLPFLFFLSILRARLQRFVSTFEIRHFPYPSMSAAQSPFGSKSSPAMKLSKKRFNQFWKNYFTGSSVVVRMPLRLSI